jgi:hypothetical protein
MSRGNTDDPVAHPWKNDLSTLRQPHRPKLGRGRGGSGENQQRRREGQNKWAAQELSE